MLFFAGCGSECMLGLFLFSLVDWFAVFWVVFCCWLNGGCVVVFLVEGTKFVGFHGAFLGVLDDSNA